MASGTLEVTQGSEPLLELTFEDGAGNGHDISAADDIEFVASVQISQTATKIIEKTLTAGQVTMPNGGSDGRIDVQLDDTDFTGSDPGAYEWQVRVTLGTRFHISEPGVLTLFAGANF